MATKGILRVVDGKVILYNVSGQIEKIYYYGNDAFTAEWYDKTNESIQVRLKDDRVFIINSQAQIERRYPNSKGQM
jgi:hypothetical protein